MKFHAMEVKLLYFPKYAHILLHQHKKSIPFKSTLTSIKMLSQTQIQNLKKITMF